MALQERESGGRSDRGVHNDFLRVAGRPKAIDDGHQSIQRMQVAFLGQRMVFMLYESQDGLRDRFKRVLFVNL